MGNCTCRSALLLLIQLDAAFIVFTHLETHFFFILLSFFAFFSVHSLTHFRNNTLKQLQDALDARPVVLIVEFADGAKRIRHVVTRIDFLSWTFERIVAKTKA